MRITGSILAVLICLSDLTAQESLSLEGAIRKGLENNFQIRISRQNTEIAKNNNAWGTVGRYPSINLGVSQNNRFDDSPSRTVPGTRDKLMTNLVSPGVNLRWTLFDGFAINISKEKLELLEEFSEGNTTVVLENAIQGIVLSYYKLLLEEEKLKVLENLMHLSGDRYQYILTKQDIGSAVTYDVLQAKDAYLSDSSTYLLQNLKVKNAWLSFRLLLGERSDTEYELTEEFTFSERDYELKDLMEKMMSDNRTLKNQYINQEILKKDISYQKSALYPSLSLNSGFDHFNTRAKYEGLPETYSYNYDYYANFTLSFNLSNGGNVKRAIRNAQIQEKIGELTLEEMEIGLGNQMINYYDLFYIKKQLYQVALVSEETAQLNLQISGDKFKSGAINSFNYRDVQLLYLNAAIGKLEAIYDLIDTHTELLRMTGGIISEY